MKFRDRIFEVLERLDSACHRHEWPAPVCRLVGRMEIGYYDRTTDWANPIYVNPEREPALYLKHAASLCAHGHREDCPKGCHLEDGAA